MSMIAGFLLSDRIRATELGTWVEATGPDGRRAGALRFDPGLLLTPGARERLVQAVIVDRRLAESGMAGLVPIADLVTAGEEVWLLAAHAVSPTLSELLSAPAMDPASAAAVLVESAQTLAALHAAGLAHGSFHPGTVLVAEDGATLLGERGLADAVRGLPPAPERDVTAWAALARGLAATWASGARGAAELFERAAVTATTRGLPAARDGLLAGRDALPGGLISRDLLAETARRWSPPASPGGAGPQVRDEGEIATMLRVPGPTQEPVHFGPGVTPAAAHGETTAEKIWRDGSRPGGPARHGMRAKKAGRARRRRAVVSAAVFALVIAGAVLAWLSVRSSPDLVVRAATVSAPKTLGCRRTATITGSLVTNGEAGRVTFQWLRSDRKEPIEQTETVPSGKTTHTVQLRWTVKGEATAKLTARLRVLSPIPQGQKIEDKATFTYKC
ncbi:hypothetical protein GCM10010412_041650 [Nonomuraea recticatena]|uniref:Ig-like domain-containing protein n=2 Tax=Nonomuraea recticatena TaxID=46178 RepID=A0ABP6EFG7_9ACTN